MSELAADRSKALALLPVSRETEARLERFVDALLLWHKRINLISTTTAGQIWSRHIVDSLQLLDVADAWRHWVDIGSGAGFPGLVIAIACADEADRHVYLVESNYKRCAFLREAARLAGAKVTVIDRKVGDALPLLPPQVDVVSARAVAPLADLLGMAHPLLKTGGIGLFPKGQDVESELTSAAKYWRFEPTLRPSVTDPAARIVAVSNLRPRQE